MVAIPKLLHSGLILASQQIYSNVESPEQASVEQYNILKFLGGQGPYIQHPGFGISNEVPEGCTLEQVQLFSRHGERYPSTGSGKTYKKIIDKLKTYNGTFKGELAFLNDYEYYVPDSYFYEKETSPGNSEGYFSGTSDALKHGATFRARYNDLYNANNTLPVFSSNSGRCFQTSNYFARGFLGDQYEEGETLEYVVVDEDPKMGVNSLTPRYACNTYNNSANSELVAEYDLSFLNNTLSRLQESNPGLNLSVSDLKNLFPYIAFEINVRGSSPFADIFTNEEYVRYQYYDSLNNYYANGAGANFTKQIGSTLLNASLALLKDDEAENKIWLSFSHDTDWEIMHVALGLVEPETDLPVDHVLFPNPYVHSQIVPQGARLIAEKYKYENKSYVRWILNDAVFPIKGCSSGPGFSCEFSDYEKYLAGRFENINFVEQCKVFNNVSHEVKFYWDYKTTTYNATLINA